MNNMTKTMIIIAFVFSSSFMILWIRTSALSRSLNIDNTRLGTFFEVMLIIYELLTAMIGIAYVLSS